MLNFINQIQDLTKNKIKLKPYMGRAITLGLVWTNLSFG